MSYTEAFKLAKEIRQDINALHVKRFWSTLNETIKRLGKENKELKLKNSKLEIELAEQERELLELREINKNLIKGI